MQDQAQESCTACRASKKHKRGANNRPSAGDFQNASHPTPSSPPPPCKLQSGHGTAGSKRTQTTAVPERSHQRISPGQGWHSVNQQGGSQAGWRRKSLLRGSVRTGLVGSNRGASAEPQRKAAWGRWRDVDQSEWRGLQGRLVSPCQRQRTGLHFSCHSL